MNINYLILAHKNLSQLDKLVAALTGEGIKFFIHIDNKIPPEAFQHFAFASQPSVMLITERVSVTWGGFSMILATLALMKAATAKDCSGYHILLSGQDFPIKSNKAIAAFLEQNQGSEFISSWQLPYEGWQSGGSNRIKNYWLIDRIGYKASRFLVHMQKTVKFQRHFPEKLNPFGGSQWWCLTADCIKFILAFLAKRQNVLEFFKTVFAPDEMLFQTIILNSPFRDKVVDDSLRFTLFEKGSFHPKTLAPADLPVMLESSALWARKFDETLHENFLQKIMNLLTAADRQRFD